jgi:N-acetylneuraminic acid mutarotase
MKRIGLTVAAILLVAFPLFSQTTSAHTSKLLSDEKYAVMDSKVDSTGWKSLKDMPTGRFAHSATVFDGKIYVFGGLETGYGPVANYVEVYDPELDTWTRLADMPTWRWLFSTSLVNGKIYAIGGKSNPSDPNGCTTVEIYNPISDAWGKRTDMPLPRLEFNSCVFDGIIYVFGGLDANEKGLNRVEVYDPEFDTWTALADMPTGRCAHSSIVRDSLIYVLGGTPGVGPYFDTALNVVEIYNPRTDTWEEGVEMPTGKSSFSATLFNDMLYTFGGTREFPDSSLALFEIFDFSKNKWLSAPDIPTARKIHTASLIDGKIYVIGGCNTPPDWPGLTRVEVFTIGDRSVTIPDTAFLYALIEEGVDTNEDSLISYAEAEAILSLDVRESGISDMTGMEAFINLDSLICSENQIDSLDVSNNTALKLLDCSVNQLASLDVSENAALTSLLCSNNQLTTLDVSKNIALEVLGCDGNQLTSLDISNNNLIGSGDFDYTELNLAANPSLKYVCVWTIPFPPAGVIIDTTGSPNVYFTTNCTMDIEGSNISGLTIFPNPTNDMLTIETVYSGHYVIEITSLNGQQVLKGEMEGTTRQIDLSSFQKGVFFITIRSRDIVTTRKIMKL